MDGMYGCFKSQNNNGVPMSSGTADVMEDQESVEASEECSGKKKSKFQTFKKFFARKKRKDTPTSRGEVGLKASQSTDNVSNTAEKNTLPPSEKDKGSGSKISLGNKAMSHDSVFVSDSSEANEALGASQDSIHGKVKSLQLQLKQAIRLGSPPSLMCVKKTEDGTMSEDDGLPCSPPEYSAAHSGPVQRTSSVSLEGTDSDDDQLSCAASSRAVSPLVVVPGDFSQPASHVVCLDNSAAKYKLGLRHKACNKRKPARRLEMRMDGDTVVEEMVRASSPDALEEREEKTGDASDELKLEEEEVAEQKSKQEEEDSREDQSEAEQDLSHDLDSSSPPFVLDEEPSDTRSSPQPSSRASSPDIPRGTPEPPTGQREYLLDPPGVAYGTDMNSTESDLALGRGAGGGDKVRSNAVKEEEEEESSLLQEVLSSLKTPLSSSSLGLELQIDENVVKETEESMVTEVGELEEREEVKVEAAIDDPVTYLTTQSGLGQTTKAEEVSPLSRSISSCEEVEDEEKDENEAFNEEAEELEEEECSQHEDFPQIHLKGEKEESQEFKCKEEDELLTGNIDLEEGGDKCKDEEMARDQQKEPETKEEGQEKNMAEVVLEKKEQEKRKEEDVEEEEGQEKMVEEHVEEQEKMVREHMEEEQEQEKMVREHVEEEEDQEKMGEEHVEEEEEQEKMVREHVVEEEEQEKMVREHVEEEEEQQKMGEEHVVEEEEQKKMGEEHVEEEEEHEKMEEDLIEEDVEKELKEGKERFEEAPEEEKTDISPVAVGEVLPSMMLFHKVDEFARVGSNNVRVHAELCDGAHDIQMSSNQDLRDEMNDGEEQMGDGVENYHREQKLDQEDMEAEQVDVDEETVEQDMEKMESNQDEMYLEKDNEDVEQTAKEQAQSSSTRLLESQLHDATQLQESETSSSFTTTTTQINLVSPSSDEVPSLLQVSRSPADPSKEPTCHALEVPEQTTEETVRMVEERKQSTEVAVTVVEETPTSSPTAPVEKLLKHSSHSLDQSNVRFTIAPAWQRSLSTGDASLKESVTAASPSSPPTWISPSSITTSGGTEEPSISEKAHGGKAEPVSSATVELVLSPGRKKNVNIVSTKPHADPPTAPVKPQSTTPQESSFITDGNPESLFGVRLRKTAVLHWKSPEEENTELVFESSAQPVSIKPVLPKKPELHSDSGGKNKYISDSSVVQSVSGGLESPSWISVAKQKQRIYKETSMEDIKVKKVEPEKTSSLPRSVDSTACSKTPEPANRVSPLETKTSSPLEEDVNPTCSPSAPVPAHFPKSQSLHSTLSSNAQVSLTTSKYPTQLYATRRSMFPPTPVPIPQRSLSLTSQPSSSKSATSPEPQSSPLTSPSFSQRVTPVQSGPTPSGAPLPSIQTSSSHRGQPIAPMPQDEPPWMALAKKKAKAWSEMPQIIQ
ncbi:cancer-related regulator of actin dynamics [Thalassophryne amazonica]|uniref:cancer-related regulator of actin dynamics n=1 Tax=Thalassophryne amazonica TaxID=390379 RepID=UPI001470D17B|nr:cancer-related regulator of actin dynamics [Thalassophryne amazonica]